MDGRNRVLNVVKLKLSLFSIDRQDPAVPRKTTDPIQAFFLVFYFFIFELGFFWQMWPHG
jgi:hypothetical protein